jgi:hypothetical protein
MSPTNTQIVEQFKQGLSPDEISLGLGYELAFVLLVLHQEGCFSRRALAPADVENCESKAPTRAQEVFKKHEVEIACVLRDVALYGENESARTKAAIYAYEEIHGRNAARVKTQRNGNTLNIKELQIHMSKAGDAVARALGSAKQVVDVQVEEVAA